MADEAALKAKIVELEKKVEALSVLVGQAGGSLKNFRNSTETLLGPFGSLVDATRSGATGLSAYNSTLDKGGETVKMLTGFMGDLGKGLNLAGGALTQYVQMVNVQSDELYKTYQDLASVGAAGKADLKSIMDTAKQFGAVSEKDLPKFAQMVSQNSETLAKFGGTVSEGLKTFGAVSAEIQQTGLQTQFMNMGMSVDSINKGMAGYLKMQTQTGAAQKMTTEELAAGTADYLKNLDVLSKLTGKSGEAIQKERDERLLNEQYSIHQRQLQQRADAGDLEAKKKLEEEDKVLSQTTGDARKGFMAAFTGMGMQTEEGRKLFMSAPEAFKMAASGQGVEAGKILDSAKGEFGKTMDQFGTLIMAAGNKFMINVSDMRFTENMKGTAEEREKAAKQQQQDQIERTAASVAAQTALTQEQRKATENLTNFVTLGIEPVQVAMLQLATATRGVTDVLPGAKSQAPEGATAAEKQRFDELQEKQKTEQGIGPKTTGLRGSQVGFKPTAEKPTLPGGMTKADIEESAAKKSGELSEAIDKTKDALDKQMSTMTGDALAGVTKLKDWINQINTAPPPTPPTPAAAAATTTTTPAAAATTTTPAAAAAGVPLPPRETRRFVEPEPPVVAPERREPGAGVRPTIETFTANISQGFINVNSANNIRFPEMPTSYKSSLDTDMMSRFAGLPTPREAKTEPVSATPRDSELIASNALVSQKLDDLIDIMRRGVTYQRKISQVATA